MRDGECDIVAPGLGDNLDADGEAFGGDTGADDDNGIAGEAVGEGVDEVGLDRGAVARGGGGDRADDHVETAHEAEEGAAEAVPLEDGALDLVGSEGVLPGGLPFVP